MINQLENLCQKYNQTHHNQLTVENYIAAERRRPPILIGG